MTIQTKGTIKKYLTLIKLLTLTLYYYYYYYYINLRWSENCMFQKLLIKF